MATSVNAGPDLPATEAAAVMILNGNHSMDGLSKAICKPGAEAYLMYIALILRRWHDVTHCVSPLGSLGREQPIEELSAVSTRCLLKRSLEKCLLLELKEIT